MTTRFAQVLFLSALAAMFAVGASRAADLDPKIVHYGNGIHYDGAKQGDTIIALHGMGPATSTPAEQK